MKKIFLLIFINISFLGISFAGGLYNLHSVSYTYGCNGNDNTTDSCGYGEINLSNKRGGSSSNGSYTCGKQDNIAPTISISGISPEKHWVNVDNYNPIKNINISVTDAGAGIRYIKLIIGTKSLIWDFGYSHKKSSFTINYSAICGKAGLTNLNTCYKSLFLEGINDIKVEAYDAVYSFYNGNLDPSNSNKGSSSTQIWVDNSKSTYKLNGSKSFSADGLGVIPNNIDPNWKNKTLTFSTSLKDKYGESSSLTITQKTCTGKPLNSIWTAPSGVDKDSGEFKSYNGNPGTSDCKWDCKIGYVKDGNKCIKKEKNLSCATYLHTTYNYNLSNVDGEKLYFVLDNGIVDKKTGIYTGVYDVTNHIYIPSLENCKIKGGNLDVNYAAKDVNGNPTTVSIPANGIILNVNPLKVISDRGQESCGSLGNLIDFNNGGAGGNGDIKANYIYKLKETYGGGYYDMKDHNDNNLINDKNEFELLYEIVDQNNIKHEDKDISKVCGEKTCVANSEILDNSSCKCIENYYPIDQTTDKIGKYSNCIELANNQCLKDTNGDGYLDTISTLGTNQIVNIKDIVYSTNKVPECGEICSNGTAKDTNGDGWKDTCAINGECGSANGGSYTSKPSSLLCNAGSASSVIDNGAGSTYTWSCVGTNEGSTASCSANHTASCPTLVNCTAIPGLWVKTTDNGTATWQNAIDTCNNLSYGGKIDWYLPSKDELNELYNKKDTIGGFVSAFYWSSTESNNSDYARGQSFDNGYQSSNNNKANDGYYYGGNYYFRYVRCVRSAN